MADHPEFWAGNMNPSISDVVEINGAPVDLSTYSAARFKARKVGTRLPLLVDEPVANALGPSGLLQYDWQAADIAAGGILDAALEEDYQALVWWELTKSSRKQDVNEAIITIRAHAPQTLAYAELEELKSTREMTGTNFADEDFRLALVAASRGVDELMGRRFYLDTADQTRYYTAEDVAYLENCPRPCGRRAATTLEIDDLVNLTSIEAAPASDGAFTQTWVLNTDFVLEPRSAASDGRPYTAIRRLSGATFAWPGYVDSIRVTGRFGWPEVPAAIKELTMMIAVRLVTSVRQAPFGVVTLGVEGAVMRASAIARTPEVSFLAAPYMRRRLFA